MIKNNIYILILLYFLTSLIIFSCSDNNSTIKIGFVANLSTGDLGTNCRNGVELGVSEINNNGGINGKKIKLIIKDDKNNIEIAKKVDKELIEEGVIAIIGHSYSTTTMAVLPIINEHKMLMISPTTSTNELTGIDDYFFRVESPNVIETNRLADYSYKKLNLRKIKAIYDLSNYKYTKNWYTNFKNRFEKLGGELLGKVEFKSNNKNNFFELAEFLIDDKLDGVIIIANAVDTAFICQQLAKLNYEKYIISSGWAMTDEFIKNSGKNGEGVIFSVSVDYECVEEYYLKFKDNYKKTYYKSPQFSEINSYETIMVLRDVLLKAKKYTSEELKRLILEQRTFKGLQSDFYIDKYGDAVRTFFIFKVIDSRFKRID